MENIHNILFFSIIILIILFFIYIYAAITKEKIIKKHKELKNRTKPCLRIECDKNYYFHKSNNQI